MSYQKISEIYEANDQTRAKLKNLVENLTDEQLHFLPAGENWTIEQIVEHISIVEYGIAKISERLLNAAKENGKTSDGSAKISTEFLQKAAASREQKLSASERVHPKGGVTIAESFAKMNETRQILEGLRPLFETVDETQAKFPHPAFGDMTSHEWLLLLGGHEQRHIAQIKRILAQMN